MKCLAKETQSFDQGTRKYGHFSFAQSICLPPQNSNLMANELLGARACLLDFCKLLQPIAPIVAISAKPTLATLNILLTLENTGQTKTSKTLVQIENLLDQHDQEVMYFFKMYSVFSANFSRSGESSESCRHLTRGASKSVS